MFLPSGCIEHAVGLIEIFTQKDIAFDILYTCVCVCVCVCVMLVVSGVLPVDCESRGTWF